MPAKIVVFESAPVIAESFKRLTRDHAVVFENDLLSARNVAAHADARIISIDQSILNSEIIHGFDALELIAVRSTGFDHIDTDACKQKRILISNVPGYAANAVAEHTFALLLAISRHIQAATGFTRRTRFCWDGLQGVELQGKTLAVIGTGAIGKRVAEIARGFSMVVKAFDLRPDHAWAGGHAVEYLAFEEAIAIADIISLNIPASRDKAHLLGRAEFDHMKQGVVILNTARGELIDNQALVNALADGTVSAAGLDVLPDEHFIREKEKDPSIFFQKAFDPDTMLANTLLCQHPRVIVTPHIGWYSFEAAQRSYDVSVDNIEAFLAGHPANRVCP